MREPIGLVFRFLRSNFTAGYDRITQFFKILWSLPKSLWRVVGPTRFCAFTLLAGGLLLFSDQGEELTVRFGDEAGRANSAVAIFLASVSWFGFQAWYWARIGLRFDPRLDDIRQKRRVRWTPVVYAALAFLAAVVSMWRDSTMFYAITTAVYGFLFLIFLLAFDRIGRQLESRARSVKLSEKVIGAFKGKEEQKEQNWFLSLPLASRLLLKVSILFSIATLGAAIIWPVAVGQYIGASAIAFLAFGHIIPIGSLAVKWSQEGEFPVITTVLVIAVLFSPFADNHAVMATTDKDAPRFSDRKTTQDAADAWIKATDSTNADSGKDGADKDKADKDEQDIEVRPVVFVATAGGGLRAAYWTATVLGALQDDCPAFAKHVFSISGVSGGSVGAALFATALNSGFAAADDAGCKAAKDDKKADTEARDHTKLRPLLQTVLGEDFLGPTITALLYPDLVQRFIPYPAFPDRGAALVGAWSEAWDKAHAEACRKNSNCIPDHKGLREPFLKLAGLPGDKTMQHWRPILLLNGTHQETGKRVIASNIRITSDVFLDAFDLHHLVQHDVSMGDAALNSARFTYVSPAGRLIRATDKEEMGHVLDGGYFENYGAVTNAEIARAAVKRFEKAGKPVRPIVIQITSDPKQRARDVPDTRKDFLDFDRPDREKVTFFMNELAGPGRGLLHTRSARGVLANKTVKDVIDSLINEPHRFPTVVKPVFAHFRLCGNGKTEPPLGWAIAKESQVLMDELLMGGCDESKSDNKQSFERILAALRNKITVRCVDPDNGDIANNKPPHTVTRCFAPPKETPVSQRQ